MGHGFHGYVSHNQMVGAQSLCLELWGICRDHRHDSMGTGAKFALRRARLYLRGWKNLPGSSGKMMMTLQVASCTKLVLVDSQGFSEATPWKFGTIQHFGVPTSCLGMFPPRKATWKLRQNVFSSWIGGSPQPCLQNIARSSRTPISNRTSHSMAITTLVHWFSWKSQRFPSWLYPHIRSWWSKAWWNLWVEPPPLPCRPWRLRYAKVQSSVQLICSCWLNSSPSPGNPICRGE